MMSHDTDAVEIVVCYGTSCFARGNAENLDLLNTYEQLSEATRAVRLTGKLCQGQCAGGPNLSIHGRPYHDVTPAQLRELLRKMRAPVREDLEQP